jgi:hypothetical protein
MSLVSDCKDRVLEKMALPVLNNSILQPYGRAMKLRIDSAAKTVVVELELKGEPELVQLQINKYELIRAEDGSYAIIKDLRTSKEWLTTLAERHLLNRRLKLPPQAANLLLRLL